MGRTSRMLNRPLPLVLGAVLLVLLALVLVATTVGAVLVVSGCISAFLSRFEVPVAASRVVLALGLVLAVLLMRLRIVARGRARA